MNPKKLKDKIKHLEEMKSRPEANGKAIDKKIADLKKILKTL